VRAVALGLALAAAYLGAFMLLLGLLAETVARLERRWRR